MMIKKNMQINEIAMQEMMKKSGTVVDQPSSNGESSSFAPASTQAADNQAANDDMDEQMRIVMEMSRVD